MNSKLITIIIGILVFAGAAYILLTSSDTLENTDNISSTTDNSQNTPTQEQNTQTQANTGAYIDYSETAIAENEGPKVLFFHAPWCPQCRALEADIKKQGVPAGVTVIKVDYDSMQDLRAKYGVTVQTTLVRIDDEGNEIEKYIAYSDPTIDSVKENLL